MIRNRYRVVLVAGIAVASIPTAYGLAFRHAPDRDKFERIREGMMWNEVASVMGRPPDGFVGSSSWPPHAADPDRHVGWFLTDAESVWVWFDRDGRVQEKMLYREPFWDRLRAWLHL